MVVKSSSVTSMHIFSRRSSSLLMSHALAWQTTSRSRGFTKRDRSQNVFGSDGAILLAQAAADVRVQRQIQRSQLLPQPVELLRERVGRHVVLAAPHGASVRKSQRMGAF